MVKICSKGYIDVKLMRLYQVQAENTFSLCSTFDLQFKRICYDKSPIFLFFKNQNLEFP